MLAVDRSAVGTLPVANRLWESFHVALQYYCATVSYPNGRIHDTDEWRDYVSRIVHR